MKIEFPNPPTQRNQIIYKDWWESSRAS